MMFGRNIDLANSYTDVPFVASTIVKAPHGGATDEASQFGQLSNIHGADGAARHRQWCCKRGAHAPDAAGATSARPGNAAAADTASAGGGTGATDGFAASADDSGTGATRCAAAHTRSEE